MDLQPTAVALALVMLLVASIDDLRRRRVDNRWWIPFLGVAVIVDVALLVEHGVRSPQAVRLGISMAVCGLFYGMWWFRLFGGADAKGMMVLSLLVPVAPTEPSTVFALDVMANGLLVALAVPLLLALANLLRGHVAVPAMLLGYRLSLDAARRQKVWPMQTVRDGRVVWAFRARSIEPEPTWNALEAAGAHRPWVTPKLPFMVPLFGGAVAATLWGNLFLRFLLPA